MKWNGGQDVRREVGMARSSKIFSRSGEEIAVKL